MFIHVELKKPFAVLEVSKTNETLLIKPKQKEKKIKNDNPLTNIIIQ